MLGVSELHMLTYVKQYANLYLKPRALQMFLITKKALRRPSETQTTAVFGLTPPSLPAARTQYPFAVPPVAWSPLSLPQTTLRIV